MSIFWYVLRNNCVCCVNDNWWRSPKSLIGFPFLGGRMMAISLLKKRPTTNPYTSHILSISVCVLCVCVCKRKGDVYSVALLEFLTIWSASHIERRMKLPHRCVYAAPQNSVKRSSLSVLFLFPLFLPSYKERERESSFRRSIIKWSSGIKVDVLWIGFKRPSFNKRPLK